ncbi:MAG: cytochrome b/b6 domain-containing protein [Helicobacteraceae bacterium]|nr:cytochrome b/b6 domain-containing protein [Helicobacteraceae bacterium]
MNNEKEYSVELRVWHWLNAIAVLGLLGTVILRKTFLSWRDNSLLIIEKFSSFDIVVTAEQAKLVAKAIRAPMWEWHIIFGLALAVLIVYRLIMIARRGTQFPKNPSSHMKIVYMGYIVLYAILTSMAVSGLVMYFHEALGISKDFAHSIKELHEYAMWSVALFVPMHIVGVFKAENDDQKGIVSKMISGN